MLSGKKIILGVTGGIAAYKSAWLVRAFIKAGAEVKVVMTPEAKDFVTPLTLSTLSKNPVLSSFIKEEDENDLWNNHVKLGFWADFFVVAPATANTLSKMANGASDNLLLAIYLSAKCPVYFAPAMDLDMYKHATTQANFKTLQGFGNIMIPAASGELASGLKGQGRMAEPEDIVAFIQEDIQSKMPLYDKKVLITAGPTYEAIDPVRFIGNYSSGKMGYALAEEAAALGASVFLISGPTALKAVHSGIKVVSITSAKDLFREVSAHYEKVDIAIAAAAVADYRPMNPAAQKIKKNEDVLSLQLEPTEDSLKYMGEHKKSQFLVGFALETENELEHAKAKLLRKNLDFIILNSLNDKGAGFKTDTNQVTIIKADGAVNPLELKPKTEVAQDIFNHIIAKINA